MLRHTGRAQRGFSLVELMVGVTVGLIVLAGVASFFTNYVSSNRQVVQMARLDQELRAAMDILARDLKRAGYKRDIHLDILNLTQEEASRAATMPILERGDVTLSAGSVEFWYDENSDNTLSTDEQRGYRVSDNTLQRYAAAAGWQSLTDPSATRITALDLSRTYRCIDIDGTSGPASCGGTPPSPGESDDGAYFVTEIAITLTGRLAADSAITRTLKERIRIRSDIYRDGPDGEFTYPSSP